MLELTINGTVYEFNCGMGFLREINKRMGRPIDGIPGEKENVGAQFRIAGVISGDPEALVDVLECANKGRTPRVTKELLDSYIDGVTDIDGLFESVVDFLKKTNATKKITTMLHEQYKKEQEAANA